ncbi:MAG: hypothetical protein AAF604_01610 [Acidobacteriota bacterium]
MRRFRGLGLLFCWVLAGAAQAAPEASPSAHDTALEALRELRAQVRVRVGEDGGERVMVTTDSLWRGGDDGLRHLAQIQGLYKLRIGGSVSDAGLVHLAGLAELEALDLHLPEVTDAGVRHLAGLVGLERLNLTYTQTSDRGLRWLEDMTRLKWLGLVYTQVTVAGVERLRKVLPNTTIEGDFKRQRSD